MTLSEVAFVGSSNSGKTTLIEALVRELRAAGRPVTVIKHTHHRIDWDTEGKDSWRFREAGARVVLRTPDWNFSEARRSPDLDRAVETTVEGGIVIHEGNRYSDLPKVVVGETVERARERGTRGPIIALAGAGYDDAVPSFEREDAAGLARFLQAALTPSEPTFDMLLERSVAAHGHLCPGQVLGVRVTVRGLQELGLSIPPPPKRLIAVVETDRCATDAVASVTGCTLGKRSLKFRDLGKMAATFLDQATGRAVRVAVRDDCREAALKYAPEAEDLHAAQTEAYRLMSDEELLTVQAVRLQIPDSDLPGRPRGRVPCARCGEHVSDGRHVVVDGAALCRSCAGDRYYEPV